MPWAPRDEAESPPLNLSKDAASSPCAPPTIRGRLGLHLQRETIVFPSSAGHDCSCVLRMRALACFATRRRYLSRKAQLLIGLLDLYRGRFHFFLLLPSLGAQALQARPRQRSSTRTPIEKIQPGLPAAWPWLSTTLRGKASRPRIDALSNGDKMAARTLSASLGVRRLRSGMRTERREWHTPGRKGNWKCIRHGFTMTYLRVTFFQRPHQSMRACRLFSRRRNPEEHLIRLFLVRSKPVRVA